MNIGLLAVDSDFPNLALMKISQYHKNNGDTVEWYTPFDVYDKYIKESPVSESLLIKIK